MVAGATGADPLIDTDIMGILLEPGDAVGEAIDVEPDTLPIPMLLPLLVVKAGREPALALMEDMVMDPVGIGTSILLDALADMDMEALPIELILATGDTAEIEPERSGAAPAGSPMRLGDAMNTSSLVSLMSRPHLSLAVITACTFSP